MYNEIKSTITTESYYEHEQLQGRNCLKNVEFYTWALAAWDKSSNRMFGDILRGLRHSVCE
jgi:hypothetical protein